MNHIEAIVQILPEPAFADRFFQVDVGRRDDPYIGPARHVVADALILLLLRESLLITRGRRARRAASAGPAEPPTLRTRLAQRLYWPILLGLMTLVILLGLLAGIAVAPNR